MDHLITHTYIITIKELGGSFQDFCWGEGGVAGTGGGLVLLGTNNVYNGTLFSLFVPLIKLILRFRFYLLFLQKIIVCSKMIS